MKPDKCSYKSCTSTAYRFFLGNHYCNEHNWYLRKKIQRDCSNPEHAEQWLEELIL